MAGRQMDKKKPQLPSDSSLCPLVREMCLFCPSWAKVNMDGNIKTWMKSWFKTMWLNFYKADLLRIIKMDAIWVCKYTSHAPPLFLQKLRYKQASINWTCFYQSIGGGN